MTTFVPLGPPSKPVQKCFSCQGTLFEQGRESFQEIFPLFITNVDQIVHVKYFHPETFSMSDKNNNQTFAVKVVQTRTVEEDQLPFHMENSPNYEYVRKNYKIVDQNVNPCVFNRVTPIVTNNYCVQCYNKCLKKQEDKAIEKKLLEVTAKPLFFCWCYLPKPFGSQFRATHIENDRTDAGVCWHCNKLLKVDEIYVGSETHPNAVLCMDGFKQYHKKLHTEK